jgi:hypothetical protein
MTYGTDRSSSHVARARPNTNTFPGHYSPYYAYFARVHNRQQMLLSGRKKGKEREFALVQIRTVVGGPAGVHTQKGRAQILIVLSFRARIETSIIAIETITFCSHFRYSSESSTLFCAHVMACVRAPERLCYVG